MWFPNCIAPDASGKYKNECVLGNCSQTWKKPRTPINGCRCGEEDSAQQGDGEGMYRGVRSEPDPTLMRSKSTKVDQSEPNRSLFLRSKSAPTTRQHDPVLTRSQSANITKLDSVSCFEGLEDYYLYMRQRKKVDKALHSLRAENLPILHMNHRTKWSICKSIFCQSQYADMSGECLIDPKARKKDLKKHSRDIFVDNFEKRWCMASRGPWRRSRFVNKSVPRTIHVRGNTYPETTFACVVRKQGSQTVFKQYFVSDSEYNVNEVPGENYTGARFVFVYDVNNHLIVRALAEEPADLAILSASQLESLYLSRRKKYSSIVEITHDPVCRLDSSKKLRLCNAVLSKFRMWWQFEVVAKVVCEKRRVSFVLEETKIRVAKKTFYEWMMTCKIVRPERTPITYYVSRGYEDNEVFIFGVDVDLQYLGRRVSVVSDHDFPDIPEKENEEVI